MALHFEKKIFTFPDKLNHYLIVIDVRLPNNINVILGLKTNNIIAVEYEFFILCLRFILSNLLLNETSMA